MINEIKQQTFVNTLDWVPFPASKRDHVGQKKYIFFILQFKYVFCHSLIRKNPI
jgi:hypothetical protein